MPTPRRLTKKSALIAKWLSVPAVFFFCLLVPVDTFVPKVRSTKRSPSIALTMEQASALRKEMDQVLERLSKRKHQNSADEASEGSLVQRPDANEIEAIEAFVGTRLPEDLRYFLEQYDGVQGWRRSYRGIVWLKRAEILEQATMCLSIHSDYVAAPILIPGSWYHPAFIPFEDIDGSGLGVDAFTGVVYHWDHDGGQLEKVANSFRDLLFALDSQMTNGNVPSWRDLCR